MATRIGGAVVGFFMSYAVAYSHKKVNKPITTNKVWCQCVVHLFYPTTRVLAAQIIGLTY